MTDHTLPEGRKAMTDADMGDLTRRLADTAIENSEPYRAAIKRAEDAEALIARVYPCLADMVRLQMTRAYPSDHPIFREIMAEAFQLVDELWKREKQKEDRGKQ
jgi:hypothetical protein